MLELAVVEAHEEHNVGVRLQHFVRLQKLRAIHKSTHLKLTS